jgi:SAM-dependent methyltransferase
MSENSGADSAYVAWKGWVNDTPFAHLDRGEGQYLAAEMRKVVGAGLPIHDVLEVGYGNGTFLAYGREQGWTMSGTELDDELVAAGIAAGYDVYAADHLPAFDDASFDLIALFDVLEHIPQDEIIGFLELLARKLRKGGRIVLRFPNVDSWLGNPMQYGDPTHVTAIGYLKMTYFALQASLEIVSFRGAKRHGFATSFAHGVYGITAGPLVRLGSAIQRVILFPSLPVVLYASNIVCVVRAREQ